MAKYDCILYFIWRIQQPLEKIRQFNEKRNAIPFCEDFTKNIPFKASYVQTIL